MSPHTDDLNSFNLGAWTVHRFTDGWQPQI